ncbi:hypothetical protein [Flavilitoribacter nigricans]|uniref:Uncharacterized protein n=1 Tax=Flavilitoribacter nigricans (strain ATCC 23147 / DSM 23189 / NBRC 102662 / NCIMB 1420 / SS-2) TaxID=1122177 RepID=A0A2D0MXG1_FLAN2|nr:hypothetical protein [Flavilitoribacter nigricans]PHN00826.1 hypothetical protein CRP01_40280 [Flavilitoribacter nigricans DSM 23189 = NBRC 102662]
MMRLKKRRWLLLITVALVGAMSTACGFLKLDPHLDRLDARVDSITRKAGAGLLAGIDTTRLDSLVNRLVGGATRTFGRELDSISLKNLQDTLQSAVSGVVDESLLRIRYFLQDSTNLTQVQREVDQLTRNLEYRVNGILTGLVPRALNEESLNRIYGLRDSLLGPVTAMAVEHLVLNSIEALAESEKLDSLIGKVRAVVDDTTVKVDRTAQGISKTVMRIGLAIGIILVALTLFFGFLWFRKRSLAKKQEKLLINLTKAIDAIPSQDAYDRTIAYLQEQLNRAPSNEQRELLQQILRENEEQYPQKQQYKAHYEHLLNLLKSKDDDGLIRQRLLNGTDDEFRQFLENALNN